MKDISHSQTGGEAAWRGLDYQKKFIAYLSLEMLLLAITESTNKEDYMRTFR